MADQAQRLREIVTAMKANTGREKRAYTYCITSGKGGVGKTSFTVNFALALASYGKKVVILDADFGFSNVNIMLGVNAKYHLGHVVKGEKTLADVMENCKENVWYISGGTGVDELMHIDKSRLENVLEQLRPLEHQVDFILFDTSAGMNDSILRLMETTDQTVLVLTAEPTSILDSYVVLKTAAQLNETPKISVLINKAASEKDAVETYQNFSNIVLKYLNYEMGMMGYISTDHKMTESITKLMPHILKYPASMASRQIQAIASKAANVEEEDKPRSFKGFFSRLIKGGN